MTGYIGVNCPVCNKKFTGADDIVVCPACGAPHHRECYFEKGQCAFQDEHISGKAWRPRYEPQEEQSASSSGESVEEKGRTCPHCDRESPSDNLFCNCCGARFEPPRTTGGTFTGGMPWMDFGQGFYAYGGLKPEDKLSDDLTAREYAAYVGAASAYYLPRFRAIENGARTLSINLSAMLFGFLYYFYRKMYLVGTLLLVLFLIGLIPSILYTREAFPQLVDMMNAREALELLGYHIPAAEEINHTLVQEYYRINTIGRMINFVIVAFVSLLSNRLYFTSATSCIRRRRAEFGIQGYGVENPANIRSDYELSLTRSGGTMKWLVAVLLVALYAIMSVISVHYVLGG